MPIYEYSCRDCDNRFEELVKANGSNAAVPCPRCGSGDTLRLLSAFAVGSGRAASGDALSKALSGPGSGGCCGGTCGCH